MPLVAGGAVAVGITLAIIVIVIVLMFRRYKKNGKFCNHLSSISDQSIQRWLSEKLQGRGKGRLRCLRRPNQKM